MTDDSIVKFCARVDPRNISLVVMTNCPPGGTGQGHVSDVTS